MKSTAIVSAFTAATLGFSSLAWADDDHRRGRGPEQRQQRIEHRENHRPGEDRRDAREARRDIREAQRDLREGRRDLREARTDRWDNRDNRRWDGNRAGWDNRRGQIEARHSRHDHRIYSGGYIPYQYRAPRYVVHDWHARHLYAPPVGHHWVDTGGDYALVAIATGLIAGLLLSQY